MNAIEKELLRLAESEVSYPDITGEHPVSDYLEVSIPAKDIVNTGKIEGDQKFKADAGKAMPDLLEIGFANALRLAQATLEYGAQKYEPHSWRDVPDAISRYARAGGRHRQDRIRDVQEKGFSKAILYSRDDESGLPHIAHELFNLLALVELALQEEAKRAGDINEKEITDNLVGCMQEPPTGHKK